MQIPVFKPYMDDKEIQASVKALELGWLGPGSYVGEFEKALAELLGVSPDNVVAVNTGTSAVHLGLKLCNVGPGDEVITPSLNNIADFQSIRALHADPVFCDVREDTLTIDTTQLESLISPKTKAIICLDYGAALCDYAKVKEIGDKHSIPVLYDAAHSFGSSLANQMVGSYSEFCTFSFDPVKNITCIDGGAVIVKSTEHATRLRHMRQLGQMQNQAKLYSNDRSWTYDVDDIGYRYHLANLHAAIGIEQLKKFDEIARKRRAIYQFYHDELGNQEGIVLPQPIEQGIFPFIFIVRVLGNKRKEFRDFLQNNGVDTGIHWQPGHKFSFFKDCRTADLSVTNRIAEEIVTIPFYPDLSKDQMTKIVETIKAFFKN